MARYLIQRGSHILLLLWLGQDCTLGLPSSQNSPVLLDPPLLPVWLSCLYFLPGYWPISIYLKYNWQNTDHCPTPAGREYPNNKNRNAGTDGWLISTSPSLRLSALSAPCAPAAPQEGNTADWEMAAALLAVRSQVSSSLAPSCPKVTAVAFV